MAESGLCKIPNDEIHAALCEIIETRLKSKVYRIDIRYASKTGESNFIDVATFV